MESESFWGAFPSRVGERGKLGDEGDEGMPWVDGAMFRRGGYIHPNSGNLTHRSTKPPHPV
jgi:hypothetical protein